MASEEKSVDANQMYENLCLVVSLAFGGKKAGGGDAVPKTAAQLEATFNNLFG